MDYIDWSCPTEMKNYEKAKAIEDSEKDGQNWQLGLYICRAISTIVKGSYPKEPMFQSKKQVDEPYQPVIDRMNFEMRMKILENMGMPMPPR